jgi:molybdate transport system regulatory protein
METSAMKRTRSSPRKASATSAVEPDLRVRVDFGTYGAIGPGKIRLLELIGAHGSISTAGRVMAMSYRRAWQLVESLNAAFERPLVTAQRGGASGGGALLTDFGREVIDCYRAIEAEAAEAVSPHLRMLANALAEKPPAQLSVPPKRRG